MGDTYDGICRICEEHTDLINGVCEDCSQEADDQDDAQKEWEADHSGANLDR